MTTQDDATQSGVPNTETEAATETQAEERGLPERERMLEAIAVDREGMKAEPSEQTEEATAAEPEQDQLAKQMDDLLEPDRLDKVKVKVKIDGVESEVTVAEMQRQFQKNGAAERRLEEATRLLHEARQAKPPVGFDSPPAKVETQDSPQSADADQKGKDFLAALFEGDEPKALALLKEIGMGRQPEQPTPDVGQLAAQLAPAIKQQLSQESALEKFKVDYADIVADPYLADIADRFFDAEVKEGKTFNQALEEAGKKTRDWLGAKGVKAETPNPTIDRNTKLARKEGIDKIPALNTKATTVEEPVPTASDIIAEMRKARGLTI